MNTPKIRLGLIGVWFVALLLMGATTPDKTNTYNLHFQLNGRWVNSDSGDVVTAYPSNEDTTGKGNNLAWVGGSNNVWQFTPDSTEVYDFYETAGADSSLGLTRMFWTTALAESMITESRQIGHQVVDSLHIAHLSIAPAHLDTASKKWDLRTAAGGPDTLATTHLVTGGIHSPDATLAFTAPADFTGGNYQFNHTDYVLFADSVLFQDRVLFQDTIRTQGLAFFGNGALDINTFTGAMQVDGGLTVDSNLDVGEYAVTLDADVTLGDGDDADDLIFKGNRVYTNVYRDSLDGNVGYEHIVVPGVSEIIALGYHCKCDAEPDYTYDDIWSGPVFQKPYAMIFWAAPKSQTAATGDTVLVAAWTAAAITAVSDSVDYSVQCYGDFD